MRECIFHSFMAEYFFNQLKIFEYLTFTLENKKLISTTTNKSNLIVIFIKFIISLKMLYTTSLMKYIPKTFNKVDQDKYIFSSTPDIPRDTNRSRDIFSLVKKRSAQEKEVCPRHKLYHHDPQCHHYHNRFEQHHRSSSNRNANCQQQICVGRAASTSKSPLVNRKSISKQLSLPNDCRDEENSFYSSNTCLRSRSYFDDKTEPELSIHDKEAHSNSSIYDVNECSTRPTSCYLPEYQLGLSKICHTPLSHAKSFGGINTDVTSPTECLSSPILSSNQSQIKYIDEKDTSGLFDDVSKHSFNDRLLYFPTINNRIMSTSSSKGLLYSKINQTDTVTDHPSNTVINTNSVMPKKELKFAVPDFLTPIIDRRPSSNRVNVKQLSETTVNLDDKIMKRRRTMKERFKDLQTDFDSKKMWHKLNKLHNSKHAKYLSSARSGSSMLISADDTEHKESPSRSSNTSCDDCRRVTINVSGLKFETWLTVLERHPTTLLGNCDKRKPFYDEYRKEYFFDRHRPSFEAIFNYYQYGGRLKRPATVSDDVFLAELEFFQIESEALDVYKKNEGYVPDIIVLPEDHLKRKLWMLFEYPETSVLAFSFSIASFIFTVISIILFCIETLPVYSQTHCEPGARPNFRDPFFIIETLCTLWFTVEIFIRFFSCPSQKAFIKDIKNLIDLAAIVPYYITLFNVLITFSCEGAKNSASLAFLRVIRLIRVFKLTKHSSGLQVLVLTFKESVEGLSLFLVAFIVCILVFSSTIYYVEIDRKGSQIESIPDAFWWAVITMCTVGYGDKVPKGPLGKVVGSVCAVAGVLTLAIPVPIITENFNKFYAHKTGRGRR
ncbi:unnamed protein product [Trichobilharzia szidati]|nr:unnamed protein product [Trichobilharzia szidati]